MSAVSQECSTVLKRVLQPIIGQAAAYGRPWNGSQEALDKKLSDFLENYAQDFTLFRVGGEILVQGRDKFGQRQLELFRSSPELWLSVKRRYELVIPKAATTATLQKHYFVDSETYGGRVESEGLQTGADLLVLHEVALLQEKFLITKAWVLADKMGYQEREMTPDMFADTQLKDIVAEEFRASNGVDMSAADIKVQELEM